ncbi:glycosyltransferase family 2 protein [Nonomuraea sp. bgisy101]|uniref:glycosyltransferase family 2 protein n=1 Tax=Nonomuraea sp. bgisy101 TaxID=3413784 RepID=UPI003D71D61A
MRARGKGVGRAAAAGIVTLLVAASWIAAYRLAAGTSSAAGVYLLTSGVLVVMLILTAWPRTFGRLEVARGRVVAIVPSYNEDQAALNATIAALLNSSRPPDEVHVVDDGSAVWATKFAHPNVFWHRQANAGKREAQALVLYYLRDQERTYGRRRADFILTVDSDSVVDRRAIRHLLRAMSDPRVQAATGLPLVRNRRANWITRLVDLEMVSACLTLRAARSRMGVVAPCSGALSLYRAELVMDNLDDYVASGTAGDDRRLTHYALQRGQAVAVDEAHVYTDMPDTMKGFYRQRVRWYRSYWLYALWEVAHLRRLPMLWRVYATVMSFLAPIALLWAFLVAPILGQGLVWEGLAYWLGLSYAVGIRYVLRHPSAPVGERLMIWLLGTPLLMLLQLLVIRPAMWQALVQARQTGWVTRGSSVAATAAQPTMPGRKERVGLFAPIGR